MLIDSAVAHVPTDSSDTSTTLVSPGALALEQGRGDAAGGGQAAHHVAEAPGWLPGGQPFLALGMALPDAARAAQKVAPS